MRKASRNFFPRNMYTRKLADELMQDSRFARLKEYIVLKDPIFTEI